MDGFTAESSLYTQAEEQIKIANDSVESLYRLVDDVSTNFPYGYEYKTDIKEINSAINEVKTYLNEFSESVTKVKNALENIDNSFLATEEEKEPGFSFHRSNEPEEEKWYESLLDSISDTCAAWSKGISSVFSGEGFGDLGEAIKQTGATIVVMGTSIASGVLKVGEYINDGLTFLGGSVLAGGAAIYDYFGDTDYASGFMDATLDEIRKDKVGELNKEFYENTSIGRSINEKSNLKYDSAGAQALKTGSEFATKVLAATAATILSGGTAAPAVIGAFYGMGSGVEKYAQGVDRENGEEYNYLKAGAKGAVSALGGALEWWGYGSMGSGIYNAVEGLKAAKAAGAEFSFGSIKSGITKFFSGFKNLDWKTFGKNFGKQFFKLRNFAHTGATVADHGVNWAFGDETTEELLKSGGLELLFSLGLNALGAGLGAYVETYQTPSAGVGIDTAISEGDDVIDSLDDGLAPKFDTYKEFLDDFVGDSSASEIYNKILSKFNQLKANPELFYQPDFQVLYSDDALLRISDIMCSEGLDIEANSLLTHMKKTTTEACYELIKRGDVSLDAKKVLEVYINNIWSEVKPATDSLEELGILNETMRAFETDQVLDKLRHSYDDLVKYAKINGLDFDSLDVHTVPRSMLSYLDYHDHKMIDDIKNTFGSSVDDEALQRAFDASSVNFSETAFLEQPQEALGYATADNEIYLRPSEEYASVYKSTGVHEMLHNVKRDPVTHMSGIKIEEPVQCDIGMSRYIGLDEAINEYHTRMIDPSSIGYDEATAKIGRMVDLGLVTPNELMDGCMKHSIKVIENAINNRVGFETEFSYRLPFLFDVLASPNLSKHNAASRLIESWINKVACQ